MRAIRWIFITGAVVVGLAILVIAAGAVWLNTYIHSDAFKVEVESRAAESLGGTVQIGQVDFNILSGVQLQNLAIQLDPRHDGGQDALKVNVAKVNCTYAWKELLDRRLKLTGITLDQPQILLTKQPPATAPPKLPPQPRPGAADSGAMQGEGTAMPFKFILEHARINNGSVTMLDASGNSTLNLHGLDVNADTSGYTSGKGITGTVKLDDILVAQSLHVTSFSTPFTYSQGGLAANPFEASAYNGKIAGDYQAQPSGPSILNLNGNGFSVEQLTATLTSDSETRLTGTLNFQSKWRGVEAGNLDGEGDMQITDGKLEGVKILEDISQILKIKELSDPIIKKGQSHFVVRSSEVQLTGLQLESDVFTMTGDGTISFNGPLNMNLVLILTRDAMNKLPSQIAASFVKQPDGSGSIAFHLTGTTGDIQTDLPERLLMQNTQIENAVNKAIDKFFH